MSKTRLIEAVKTLDLKETKRILEAKPELLKVWNEQGRNLLHPGSRRPYRQDEGLTQTEQVVSSRR